MFEPLMRRAARLAVERATGRRERVAGRLREAGVAGVTVSEEGEAVVLAGRGLGRRLVLDPELRWLVAESKDER